MILVDENTPNRERVLLESRRLTVRQVGYEWGRKGISDEEIVTALRSARRVTFFTRDADFYRRDYCHASYCLALVAAGATEVAAYAIRFFRHRAFRTHSQRMGTVVRLQPSGIVYWSWGSAIESYLKAGAENACVTDRSEVARAWVAWSRNRFS